MACIAAVICKIIIFALDIFIKDFYMHQIIFTVLQIVSLYAIFPYQNRILCSGGGKKKSNMKRAMDIMGVRSLQDIQLEMNVEPKRLQQDIRTRWNSTYFVIESLLEQKRVLSAYAADHDPPTTLTANQWALLEKTKDMS
ncbi:zinc finger BED domain-containing 4-like protein [Labeo rohita]|uniref:Zinc finger BED domain-containing 4-like protein n=1 Tax=Labeo rohita TaxID=84645 RepID=A0A498M201_LABRO|nr:zinc finger BED domain-containing 4-like protein [Labeo rohita]